MSFEAIGEATRDGKPLEILHRPSRIIMALAPPGTFVMGAGPDDLEAFENEPRSEQLVEAFYIGIHPVTQSQYRETTKTNPAAFRLLPGADDRPIENVRATEAEEFARLAGNGLRLPTEIEWEYACRAGSSAPRHGPIDEVAWHKGHPQGRGDGGQATAQVVKRLSRNAWGLYDALGNVWEWTATRDESADGNVVRGGSFMSLSRSCRASARFSFTRSHASREIGFRVAVDAAEVLNALYKRWGEHDASASDPSIP